MDFGLSGITKALNLPTLGKRGSALENVTEVRTFQDEQNVKRGRFDRSSTNKDDISGGWWTTLAGSNEAPNIFIIFIQ